ncbi:hypothetical protein A2996_01880 [Candidatus Campbellbacteria bacterium RIFCSPLOWO2_01_FULL_34_15]|uniref:Peptidoglycan binding-like domain-containing protein n=2 Tax=Candidatus Campbelliibacteriota TaxID=1752727 RepID=A0A1F5EPV6_9BACT|nr:MAG: hypothetical protein A2811_00260 [Candidatus Campbellbacteria bacterium RIFCSPHIGHO2_01_FULL_34_10]OGD69431.1 MAG: hypothetical protein A2996_01880 [Candidatus Campbellbacteria bacterium RIFCSPLOWO2_01_FULL_34_15]
MSKNSKLMKIASKFLGVTLALTMLVGVVAPVGAAGLTQSQIDSILGLLSSFGADQATINNVNAALTGAPVTGGTTGGSTACSAYTFTRNLTVGNTGTDVMELQKVLNMSADTQVAASGVGSAGNESSYFGSLSKSAVIKFQNKYASEVLTPVGLTSGTGYVGASTRAKLNTMCSGTTQPPVTPPTTGTGVTVSNTTQPSNSLAVENATRVPFTKFTVTAGNDGDVVINTVTVERQGLSNNAVFAGVVLLDEDGTQLGLSKTLNSNNQATIGEAVTVKSGTSRTFTVAGNMASVLDAYAGQVASLALISVNTSASVSGSLPIVGALHTINATVTVGTVSAERGILDPNTSPTKEVGTVGYTFSAVKLTAGSAEDVTVRSIRFNQSGTASADDLANVQVVIDGTSYATALSADKRYYTATFGTGIVIAKGLTKDISIKGDIVSGSDRTIIFDVEKATDIDVTGNMFGYGITPSATASGTVTDASSLFPASGNPWYDASAVTVGTGTVNVSATNDVPAGNIVDGGSNVSLGSFEFDVRGEAVTWSSIALSIGTTSGSGTDGGELLTNVTLVDGNGTVLAGPQDPTATGLTVTISDTVTLPVGKTIVYVKANLNNSWENNDTIIVSFTPSTAITSLKGDTSGKTVTATPAASVAGKTQTVNAGSLTVTPATSLVSQNIIDGSTNVVLGRYVLDGSASGEDVKVTTVQIRADVGTNADIDELNSLTLYDVTNGANRALTTGSNVNNPSGHTGATDGNLSFTIDSNALVVAKNSQMIVELRGTVDASTTPTTDTTFKMDFSAGSPDWTATGADTGKAIVETFSTSAGATLTVTGAGTLTASLDTSSPTEMWYKSGDEATIGVFKFVAVNEDMSVTDLGLSITTASSSASDFQSISIYNGSTLLRTLTSPAFTSGTQTFTFNSGDFTVPKGDDGAKLTVKAKFSEIGTGLAGESGNLVKIATSSTATQNKARGLSSGTAINILGSASNSEGARYFKATPTVSQAALGSTLLSNGTKELYKFTVTANGGDVDLYKFTFNVATTGCEAASFSVTESTTGKTVASGLDVTGATDILDVVVSNSTYGATQITIPEGETRTYVLTATVTGAAAGDSIVTQLEGDAAYIAAATNGLAAGDVDSDANDDFIWSDRSNSSHTTSTADWYNGYKVNGLPTTNLNQSALSL